ncbi:MAG: SGNH/GDSL hydrolase family protein, partial [Nanoarchaeota archaeon]
ARIEHECKARSAKRAEDDRNTILIAVGNNDTKILTGEKQTCVSAEDFGSNIERIIAIAKKHADDIALVEIIPVDEKRCRPFEERKTFNNTTIQQYNTIIRDAARTQGVTLIHTYDAFLDGHEKMLADGLHPNAKGYQRMHDIIKAALEGII